MVDELIVWAHAKHRCFKKGSAHLSTDGPIEELHAFAAAIGLKRSDLSPARREAALAAGAVFVPAREQALARRARRGAPMGGNGG